MYICVNLPHFNDLLLKLFKLFLKLGPNLHLSYGFLIFQAEQGKSLCFKQIFHLMLLVLSHIFFTFHTIVLFQASILCVLFDFNLQLVKPIQRKEEIFIKYPLLGKLKISIPSDKLSFNFHLYYQ